MSNSGDASASAASASKSSDQTTSVGDSPTTLEMFKLARGYIEHENTLIGQRITWFLTCQGLLFTAFFLVAQLPWKETSSCYLGLTVMAVPGAVLIALLGGGSSILVCRLIAIANDEIADIESWWADLKGRGGFPPRITGSLRRVDKARETTTQQGPFAKAHRFAYAFTFAWAIILIAFLFGARAEIAAAWKWARSNDRLPAGQCRAVEKASAEVRLPKVGG